MNKVFYVSLLISAIFVSVIKFGIAQCNINSGCAPNILFSIDPPVFNAANLSITYGNITFGEINCTSGTFESGLVIYIYQLMPDGSRTYQCSVEGPPPSNNIGSIILGFGQNVNLCGQSFNLGSIVADPSNGFEPCDGVRIESEAILYTTQNLSFNPNNTSVYSALAPSEYVVMNLGTVDVNINNQFPGNGQPLTTAIINDFATGSNGPVTLNCGEDIELYVEALSRLGNCLPYNDISTGIPSELENTFYYSINGGSPVIVSDVSTGAIGGQITGPDTSLGGSCYAGILTGNGPYVLPYADIANLVCDGDEIVFTVTTTDLFTNITVQDQITIIYSGRDCSTANCCSNVDLNLNFDGYPGQTSWQILDLSNNTIASSGSYNTQTPFSNVVEGVCLTDGCYTLVVNDAIGNGMCPFQSSAIGVSTFITPGTLITPGSIVGTFSLIATPGLCGNYNLTDANGTLLASGGGAFGSSQTRTFCLNNGLAPRLQNPNLSQQKHDLFDFQLLPNPATDFVSVVLSSELKNQNEILELSVLDISGKILISQASNNLQIDINDLKAGYYLMKVSAGNYTSTKKFLKQ